MPRPKLTPEEVEALMLPRIARLSQKPGRSEGMSKPIETCHQMLGMRIRMMRETLGLTQDELAKKVSMTRVSLTNIETGRQRLLLHGVENFAKALGTTPKHLMKGIWW